MLSVSNDLTVTVGERCTQLSPAQAFRAAERLIRAATRAIVNDEADRAVVREFLGHDEARN